jgi:hypothetical protein
MFNPLRVQVKLAIINDRTPVLKLFPVRGTSGTFDAKIVIHPARNLAAIVTLALNSRVGGKVLELLTQVS